MCGKIPLRQNVFGRRTKKIHVLKAYKMVSKRRFRMWRTWNNAFKNDVLSQNVMPERNWFMGKLLSWDKNIKCLNKKLCTTDPKKNGRRTKKDLSWNNLTDTQRRKRELQDQKRVELFFFLPKNKFMCLETKCSGHKAKKSYLESLITMWSENKVFLSWARTLILPNKGSFARC